MDLALFAGFLTATVLLYSWAYGVFHNTNPNAVNAGRSETKASAVSIAITGLLTAALAFGISAAVHIDAAIADLNTPYLAEIVICAALLFLLPKRLMARARVGHGSPAG